MKKSLIIVPLVASIIGTHYVVWDILTNKLAEGLTKQLTKLNENAKDDMKISYEDRKTSGYPTKSMVTFTKPTLKSKDATILIEEDLTFSSGLMGDYVKMQSHGAIVINDAAKSYKIVSDDGLKCNIAADSIVNFIAANKHLKQGKFSDVAKNIRAIGCEIANFTVTEGEKKLASAKLYSMSFNSSPAAKTSQMVDFSIRAEDFEIFDDIDMLNDAAGTEYADLFNVKYADLGKQNFIASGGAVFDTNNSSQFQFNLRELKISNNLYNIDFPLEIVTETESKIKHSGTFDFTEKFDVANIELAKKMLEAVKKGENNNLISDDIAKKIKNNEVADEVFINIVPQLQKYSKIETFFNANGDFSTMKGAFEKVGFSTSMFGLTASGETKNGDAQIEINCQNCEVMITNFANYANDVAKMLHACGETASPQVFSNEAIGGIIKLYQKYDINDDDKNVTWKIVKKGETITISDKPQADFMVDANEVAKLIPTISGL